LIQLFVVAVVQGITEFLPISSSGHLVLIPAVTGWPDQGLVIDVAVHLGTLVAVVAYFRRDVGQLAAGGIGLLCGRWTSEGRLALLIAAATMPAVLAGFVMTVLDPSWTRSVALIGWTTLLFGILLWVADRFGPMTVPIGQFGWRHALLIGLAQALALLPGTSRSGMTMTAARTLGYSRVDAAKIAMLLSVPIIIAASAVTMLKVYQTGGIAIGAHAIIAATLAATTAWLAIGAMMAWLARASFTPFVLYRIALGALLLGWAYG
jgi:undecaprenyl-diphosphatase